MHKGINKIVLAYTGGFDTTVALNWLKETYDCEIVTFTAMLGQGADREKIREKALANGASEAYVENMWEEFTRDYIFPMLRANTVYEGSYMLGTAISRPIITKRMIQIAKETGADAIAHGATGKGNDQVRFELAAYALDHEIKTVSPWRESGFKDRTALIEYAKEKDIEIPDYALKSDKQYFYESNIFHTSHEGGDLDDPWKEATDDSTYTMTTKPEDAPNEAEYIEIEFEKGDPIAINGQYMRPAALLSELNTIGGKHAIGRVDVVENRYIGMKNRGIYETPGGTVLMQAHKAVESITVDREVAHLKEELMPKYASLIYNGYWFSPERTMLQDAIDHSQRFVTGTARLKLYKGNAYIVGRKSPNTLYSTDIAIFNEGDMYNKNDAEGFIKINSLRLCIEQMARNKKPS
ncbi:MAG: argininosuccinate synthase [Alphaproteobacteria bacterium]|nr:argininosuccinate synthase [Alphaproteobacteria bacterium]